jgi:pimeloyl-ACP methyl ester carboxylesterase
MSASTTAMTSLARVNTPGFWVLLWRTSGIQFGLFLIIAYVICGFQPQVGASPGALVAFYHGDRPRMYEGDRFAESIRYVQSYPTELEMLRDALPHIQTPAQIIAGRRDRVVPPVNAEYLHERLLHSELHLIDSGHFVWEDAADEYAALVKAWWGGRFKTMPLDATTARTRQAV